jgi:exopolysaccharide biosynthesis protein
MYRISLTLCFLFLIQLLNAQVKWLKVDSLYQPLPSSVHVYRTNDSLNGKPNIAYYLIADLKDKHLVFDADTTLNRRLTPTQFYEKNNNPLVVVNCTFFSFETNKSLNTVIKDGRLVAYNIHSIPGRGKDTFTYRHPFGSALGISKKRQADVTWLYTDSSLKYAYSWSGRPSAAAKDSSKSFDLGLLIKHQRVLHLGESSPALLYKWKMQTAVGGGPVLLQNGEIKITNEEELKFAGKAINDKHPRTAMGYTKDGKLIILVTQGRYPGIAEGATLNDEAQILKRLGCWEALNLDGGGSTCMLINGKNTITPSEKGVQRPVPAVFLIKIK